MGQQPDATADVAIVRRMAGGDREALGLLYDRYGATLFSIGVHILGDRESAADLVQDVFLEAWRKAGAYDPQRATVRTWLIVRARSRALDRVTSAPHRRTVTLDDASVPEPAAPDPGQAALGDADRIHAGLAALSVDQRRVLELTFFQGLSSGDIAREVGVPIGTVKSRLRAGLIALRAALRAEAQP